MRFFEVTNKNMLSVPVEAQVQGYERWLLYNEVEINKAVKDILDMRVDAIRRTKVNEMTEILRLFSGTTQNKKREELIEFLKLMPAYRTCDKDLLLRRLQNLKELIKRRDNISDLLVYAKLKQQEIDPQQPEEEE